MIRCLMIVFALLAVSPVSAAQQLTGSHAVMELPDGFEESREFIGALWREAQASILVTELPAEAFEPVAEGLREDPAALSDQGVQLDTVEATALGPHQALIGRGRQQAGAQAFEKWLLLAGSPQVTLLVTAQIPSRLATPQRVEKIEAALASIRIAPERGDPRGILPFTFGETQRFQFARALSGRAALMTDTAYEGAAGARPVFVIAASPGANCEAWSDGTHAFAAEAMASLQRVEDLAVADSYDARIGGGPAVVTEATGTVGGEDVIVVQTIRFRDCAYLRTVGIGPAANEALYRAEFDMLAAGAGWKPKTGPDREQTEQQ